MRKVKLRGVNSIHYFKTKRENYMTSVTTHVTPLQKDINRSFKCNR